LTARRLAAALLLAAPLLAAPPRRDRPPLGFLPGTAAPQLESETRLATALSAESLSELHRMLTRRPHVAGTPQGRALADEIASRLDAFGLATEKRTYEAYLSHPRRLRVDVVEPDARPVSVEEPADARDPDTAQAGLTPGFIAYSASANVRGPLVYVNYGLPADYEALESAGVSPRGAVVVARYGRVHRAVKVHTAETRGAVGILIYSDPADDGYAQGDTWPDGAWRAPSFLQRGNAKYSWFWHGDPLTPNAPAHAAAARLDPARAPTLPRIPAVALSWAAAEPLLRELRGPGVPRGFQGGLPFAYHAGPGPLVVKMDVAMDAAVQPIVNVLGRIDGHEEPDRWVVLGTHHDAWTFGGVDPGSSAAAMLELARALGDRRRSGWRPRRTIVFAFWDAEEYGLVGSTEYAEDRAPELRERAVAYVNSDLYLRGRLEAGGTASLRDFVADVAGDVEDPGRPGASLYESWRDASWKKLPAAEKRSRSARFDVELDPLGSGADFVPFQTHLGLPSLSLEFGIEGSYGSYHSIHDTRRYMETFGDPGWRHGRALAELLGRVALRLASADVLPLRFGHTADKLAEYVAQLEARNADAAGRPQLDDLDLEELKTRLAAFTRAARAVDARTSAVRGDLDPATRRRLNDHLAGAEKSFASAEPHGDGSPRWYRHTVYGWDIYALYSGDVLPALGAALRARDAARFAAEKRRLSAALERATAEMERAAALVP
jgi:N-acetylated-alpha-linked acidic dipeptidase